MEGKIRSNTNNRDLSVCLWATSCTRGACSRACYWSRRVVLYFVLLPAYGASCPEPLRPAHVIHHVRPTMDTRRIPGARACRSLEYLESEGIRLLGVELIAVLVIDRYSPAAAYSAGTRQHLTVGSVGAAVPYCCSFPRGAFRKCPQPTRALSSTTQKLGNSMTC